MSSTADLLKTIRTRLTEMSELINDPHALGKPHWHKLNNLIIDLQATIRQAFIPQATITTQVIIADKPDKNGDIIDKQALNLRAWGLCPHDILAADCPDHRIPTSPDVSSPTAAVPLGRQTDRQHRCDECDPSFGCFGDGTLACQKVPLNSGVGGMAAHSLDELSRLYGHLSTEKMMPDGWTPTDVSFIDDPIDDAAKVRTPEQRTRITKWYQDALNKPQRADPPKTISEPGARLTIKRAVIRPCKLDTDGDGNCPVHPEGCPVPERFADNIRAMELANRQRNLIQEMPEVNVDYSAKAADIAREVDDKLGKELNAKVGMSIGWAVTVDESGVQTQVGPKTALVAQQYDKDGKAVASGVLRTSQPDAHGDIIEPKVLKSAAAQFTEEQHQRAAMIERQRTADLTRIRVIWVIPEWSQQATICTNHRGSCSLQAARNIALNDALGVVRVLADYEVRTKDGKKLSLANDLYDILDHISKGPLHIVKKDGR